MNSLQAMVTDSLQIKNKEELSPRQILQEGESVSSLQMAEKIESAIKEIETNPELTAEIFKPLLADIVLCERLAFSSLFHFSSSRYALELLWRAEEETERDSLISDLKTMRAELLREERIRRRQQEVGSFTPAVSYLEAIFEDDLEEILVSINQVGVATARKWRQGGSATWQNSNRIQCLARTLYDLQENYGWAKNKVKKWLYTPLSSGSSPLEVWHKSTSIAIPPQEVRAELQRLRSLLHQQ